VPDPDPPTVEVTIDPVDPGDPIDLVDPEPGIVEPEPAVTDTAEDPLLVR
jgi:hypothetical protein